MKWVKLIGGRFLAFIIMGAVVTLIFFGLAYSGARYLDSTRVKALKVIASTGILIVESGKYYPDEEIRSMIETELFFSKRYKDKKGIEKYEKYVKLKRQLNRAVILLPITVVLSIAIGLFGVISIFGIVFRREGLTQREGFVRVWVGVPKYFAGYFKKSNTGGE